MKKALCFILIPFLLFFALPVNADKKEERKWEDEIIYSLLVDRFYNGNYDNDVDVDLQDQLSYQGGDFQGIIRKLDYLEDLGFTSIMLSPIFANEDRGFHGEWVTDFYAIEKHFGTLDDFKQLVEEAHHRNIKVILEFPLTHVGSTHPWVSDPAKQDWFTESTANVKEHTTWLKDVPALHLENDEVQDYLIEVATWWINETKIDGYSIPHVDFVPETFMKELVAKVKAEAEPFYVTGTVAIADEQQLAQYQQLGMDGLANLPGNAALRDIYSQINISVKPLFDRWDEEQNIYPDPLAMTTYFDDKNTERFTYDMVDKDQYPGARWKTALTYLYTQPQIPIIFYGTEIAINGEGPPHNLPLMNFRAEEELMEHIQKLGKVRQAQTALTRGTMELLYEDSGMVVFKREYNGETVVAAINNTTVDQKVVIPASQLEDDKELRGLLGTDMVRSDQGEYKLTINREMSEIYKLENQSGINLPFIISLPVVFGAFALFLYVAWKRGKKRDPYEQR